MWRHIQYLADSAGNFAAETASCEQTSNVIKSIKSRFYRPDTVSVIFQKLIVESS